MSYKILDTEHNNPPNLTVCYSPETLHTTGTFCFFSELNFSESNFCLWNDFFLFYEFLTQDFDQMPAWQQDISWPPYKKTLFFNNHIHFFWMLKSFLVNLYSVFICFCCFLTLDLKFHPWENFVWFTAMFIEKNRAPLFVNTA